MTLSYQDVERAAHCTFRPLNGGWYSRCRERATLIEVSKSPYREKRCEKHARLDERTAKGRQTRYGWGNFRTYEPFDSTKALALLVIERDAQAENARLVANHETLVAALSTAVATGALSAADQPIVERLLKAYRGE